MITLASRILFAPLSTGSLFHRCSLYLRRRNFGLPDCLIQATDANVALVIQSAKLDSSWLLILSKPQVVLATFRENIPIDEVIIRALLAEDASGSLGFVTYTVAFAIWNGGDILRVDDVFMVERARQSDLGRPLVLRTAEIAVGMKLATRWEIEPANHAAQAFYRGLGVAIRDKVIARWDVAAMKAGLVNSR